MDPAEEIALVNRIGQQYQPDMYSMVDAIFIYLVDDATDQTTGEGPDGADLVEHWRHAKQLLKDYVYWRQPAEWAKEIDKL